MANEATAVNEPEEVVAPKPGAESAPAEESGDAGSHIETPENGAEAVERTGRGDSPIATITDLRRDRRQLRAQNEQLTKQVQELMARSATAQPTRTAADAAGAPNKESPTFFEDPDKHLAAREQNLRSQVISDIMSMAEKQEALKLIRSQNGFSEKDEDAFADLMQENGLDILAQSQPLKAARLAAKLWQEEKGLRPVSKESKAKAASVRGGAPAGGVQKISLSHIRSLQTRLSKGENVDKELADAWAAAKEGRIIED
jgi:hypothetical protein